MKKDEVELKKPGPLVNQISVFLNDQKYTEAHELALDFVKKFPDNMVAHFLLAKTAYCIEDFELSKSEGRKAFNMSKAPGDMTSCAIITASAHYRLNELERAMEMLRSVERTQISQEIEEMMATIAFAMENEEEAFIHIDKLMKINKQVAQQLIEKFLSANVKRR
ncbi:MAG: hypothetical protein ACP5N9_02870 [Candidatus Bilamarchaeum sp.]|jgi:tetratricopeptide (TPR) repeat protein